jgi:hypothetical protein
MFRRILTVTALTVSASLLAGAGVAAAHPGNSGKGKPAASTTSGNVVAKVSRGTTTLTLKATVPGTVNVRRPASASGSSIQFPITWGKVTGTRDSGGNVTVGSVTLAHVGGLEITNGATKVTVRNLMVEGATLTAQVKVNAGRSQRLPIGTLSAVTATTDGKTISATATVTFLEPAKAVLGNDTGTVNVSTRIIGKVRPG